MELREFIICPYNNEPMKIYEIEMLGNKNEEIMKHFKDGPYDKKITFLEFEYKSNA